jgi:hypothetical protein
VLERHAQCFSGGRCLGDYADTMRFDRASDPDARGALIVGKQHGQLRGFRRNAVEHLALARLADP